MSNNRFAVFIHHVHIADGFADDCDELIHRCSSIEPLTYKSFCKIWKEMNFASMYKERLLGAEIAELSEEVLHIAKRYMVANTSNFEESVAGLFLVYALLSLQPYSNFSALRIIPEDLPAVNRIEIVARRERRYEVLYILGAVLVRGPCHFHVAQRERGAEPALRKYLEGYTGIDKQGVRPKGVFYRQNEELDIIRELNTISRRYTDAKNALTTDSGEVDRNLYYEDKDLAAKLDSSLKKIINGLIDDEVLPSTSTSMDHSDMVQSIKSRAMKTTVGNVKHLTGIRERSQSKSPRKPTSPALSKSPKSNISSPNGKAYKRKRNISIESTDSVVSKITANDIELHSEDSQDSIIEIREADLVGSLPILLTTAQDQEIQIEFIDKSTTNQENPIDNGSKEKKSPRKAKETEKNKEFEFEVPVIQGPVGVFKIPEVTRVRKMSKKYLKKTVIKSKLKKMGILPVADMEIDDKNS